MRHASLFCLIAVQVAACGGARSTAPHQPATSTTASAIAPVAASSAPAATQPRPPVAGIPRYVPQTGHFGEITALAWNQDGRLVATASKEEGVKLWAMPEGDVVAELHTQNTDPSDLAFGPDGHSLAVANWSGALEVWDLDELRPRTTHRDHQGSVQSVAYSPDGGLLLSGGEDGMIYVYETRAQKLRGRITGMPAAVYAMAFSPDGKRLACSAGSKVQLRESGTWRPLHALEGHTKPVTSLAWSPDNRSIATGGEDGLVNVWDAEKGTASRRIETRQGVESLAWNRRGEELAAVAEDDSTTIWRAADGAVLHQWRCERCAASAASFNPGASSVALAGDELVLLETSSGRTLSRVERASRRFARWQPGRDLLVLADPDNSRIEVEVDGLGASVARWWSQDNRAASWSRDGARVAVWTKDAELQVADTRDGKTIASRELKDFGLPKMEFSPSGKPVGPPLPELALSPDGKQLALFDANTGLRLWQVGGPAARKISEPTVDLATWSPDGSILAFFSDGWTAGEGKTLRLWNVSASRQIGRLPLPTELGDIDFRPDGKQIVGAERGTGRIRIWDVATRHELSVLEGPVRVDVLGYSPDGRWLAASGNSGVRVWDAQTWKLKQSIEHASSHVSWHRGSKVLALSGELPMLLRVDDGESLWVETAGDNPVAFVFATDGLYDGVPFASSTARFRVGKGAIDSGMIPASQLPDTYKHAGLLRDFVEGRPLPHPQAVVAAQPH